VKGTGNLARLLSAKMKRCRYANRSQQSHELCKGVAHEMNDARRLRRTIHYDGSRPVTAVRGGALLSRPGFRLTALAGCERGQFSCPGEPGRDSWRGPVALTPRAPLRLNQYLIQTNGRARRPGCSLTCDSACPIPSILPASCAELPQGILHVLIGAICTHAVPRA
jgi:hypothetical protein